MKKVTIPTCANPFVVIVNGIKYTYPAGATVSVPDDVAAVIEQHDEAHNNPKPDPVVPPFVPTPSEGGNSGTIPVVEITSELSEDVSGYLNAADSAALNAAFDIAIENGTPVKIIIPVTNKIKVISVARASCQTYGDVMKYKWLRFDNNQLAGFLFSYYNGDDYWEIGYVQ